MLTILAVVSYISSLILITPPAIFDIIAAVLLCIIGVALIIWKKPQNKVGLFANHLRSPLFYVTLAITAYLGYCFFNRWKGSAKIRSISAILHIPSGIIVALATIVISLCAMYFLYCFVMELKRFYHFLNKRPLLKNLTCGFIASAVTVIACQVMIIPQVFTMGRLKFFVAALLVYATVLIIYCLTGWIKTSVTIGTGIFILISITNVYVYNFRGRLFEPVDIFSTGTAMNVVDNYSLFPIPSKILVGTGIWLAVILFLSIGYLRTKYRLSVKRRITLAVCGVVGAVCAFGYASMVKLYPWRDHGAILNGYILDFAAKFRASSAVQPEGYSVEKVEQLADEYSKSATSEKDEKPPHIIVIMDEAFSDLSVLGEISTNKEVTPYISSLKENTVSGYALASIYGGTTANSEYEFLTGNSMAWLTANASPYQQYIRSSTYSMVSYLKSNYDYNCVAMHPYTSTGWNRPEAYKNLGFDKIMFKDAFPGKHRIRQFISDREMFDTIIDTYEKQEDNPLFVFGVTMQNHGGYTFNAKNFDEEISLVGYDKEYRDVEQYLSLLHETDKAVEHLVSYFESVDEEVVIVFFGDHQPNFENDFFTSSEQVGTTSLTEQQQSYKVPFFIWANYDIEEKSVDCTSLSYLSSYVYDVAGISMPSYNRFLAELEENIPSINPFGYYSLKSGCYLPFDQATGKEKEWLLKYEQLQYNCIFDKKNRSKTLFPTLE